MTNKQHNVHNTYNRIISLKNQKPARIRGFDVGDKKSLEAALNRMEEILDNLAGKGNSINYIRIPSAIIKGYEKIEVEVADTLARMPENEAAPYKERLEKIRSRMTYSEPSDEGRGFSEKDGAGYLVDREEEFEKA